MFVFVEVWWYSRILAKRGYVGCDDPSKFSQMITKKMKFQ